MPCYAKEEELTLLRREQARRKRETYERTHAEHDMVDEIEGLKAHITLDVPQPNNEKPNGGSEDAPRAREGGVGAVVNHDIGLDVPVFEIRSAADVGELASREVG